MANFQYKAVDHLGKRKTGVIVGANKDIVKSQLARMRYRIIKLEEVSANAETNGLSLLGGRIKLDKKGNMELSLSAEGKVTDKVLIVFIRQLQTMISSGVPLNQSLEILSRQQRVPSFRKSIEKVQKSIEEGGSFSESLAKFPKTFDSLVISMVRAGEESGKIAEILTKLGSYVEKSAKMKQQIKSAMTYPTVIMFVAVSVICGLLIFVVPALTSQFTASGRELPALTQFVMNISDAIKFNWYYILGALAGIGYGLVTYFSTVKGKRQLDGFLLRAPIVGDLVRKVVVGRFCSTMASMLGSGVNIMQALTISSQTSGNVEISDFILHVRAKVEQGQLLSVPIKENKLFPMMVTSMIEVGEKSGRLEEMLLKVSDFYEEEVAEAVKNMISMIEPILIVFIGITVGILVVAMYLPILDMGNNIGN